MLDLAGVIEMLEVEGIWLDFPEIQNNLKVDFTAKVSCPP